MAKENLNPIEEANGYKQLMEDYGLTQEEVSNRVQKSRSAVANSLRLLSLPKKVLALVEDGRLSMGHARAILSAKSEDKMFEIANNLVKSLNIATTGNTIVITCGTPKLPGCTNLIKIDTVR